MPWNLSGTIIGILLFVAGYLLGHHRARVAANRVASWRPNPNITDDEIKAALRAGRKIDAIKLYRQRNGSDLKQARQAVEAMAADLDGARTAH